MKSSRLSWKAAGVLGTAIGAVAFLAAPSALGDTAAEPDLELFVSDAAPHAGCTFFGAQRDEFLRVGLGAELRAATERSRITQAVVQKLTPAPPPLRSRSRPRGGSGPIAGESIDDFIFRTLERQRIPPAPRTTDAELLRRVSLDLTGQIPIATTAFDFITSQDAGKREELIETLLASSEWADRWALFFGDLYRNTRRTSQVNRYANGRDAFHLFLRDSMRANKAYDQMALEILSAAGVADGRSYPPRYSSYEQFIEISRDYESNPVQPTPASYIVGGLTPGGPIQDTFDALAFITARDFLGIQQMDCILCHDGIGHLESLSVWGAEAKRSEGWGLASFFTRVLSARPPRVPPRQGENRGPRPRYWTVLDGVISRLTRRCGGEYCLDTDGGNRPERTPDAYAGLDAVTPRYPFGGGAPAGDENRRVALGRLLAADPQFARAIVNYVWKEFFGRGIVDPVDQFDLARLDPANPPPTPWEIQPSHPELLEWLARDFADNGFDLKRLMRMIVNSEAYQLSARYDGAWSPSYDRYFARRQVRRLRAEEIHDALVVSSAIPVRYPVSNTPELRFLPFAGQFPDVVDTPRGGRSDRNAGFHAGALLDSFFRGDRAESPRSAEPSILQALQLMNNPLVVARVTEGAQSGLLSEALNNPDDVLVGILYLAVLTRLPSEQELVQGVQYISGGDRAENASDLMWALYNKVDFIYNY